jgi:hypothetical protein
MAPGAWRLTWATVLRCPATTGMGQVIIAVTFKPVVLVILWVASTRTRPRSMTRTAFVDYLWFFASSSFR